MKITYNIIGSVFLTFAMSSSAISDDERPERPKAERPGVVERGAERPERGAERPSEVMREALQVVEVMREALQPGVVEVMREALQPGVVEVMREALQIPREGWSR